MQQQPGLSTRAVKGCPRWLRTEVAIVEDQVRMHLQQDKKWNTDDYTNLSRRLGGRRVQSKVQQIRAKMRKICIL